ncbi:MAG: hypothetical protein KME16_14755 [Scytolyngbya sp. HA4215-MV1]|nr:hypothetical protein [Scytolyngbya sp. HA4215-MV1]
MNYRHCLIGLILTHLIFFNQVLVRGEVIFPHANDAEVTGLTATPDHYLANRKFSDQSSVYIPEINHHLNGKSHQWLSTWNPAVQLGRPTFQLSALGKAYPITHLLAWFTQNPFRLYTTLTILTVFLTSIFFFLYLKALQLSPLACLVPSLGLSLGIYVSYWLTFIMFVSTLCWSAGLLWFMTKLTRRRSLWSVLGISFATYNLLLSGYPQLIILCAYIITIQVLVNCRHYWTNWQDFLIKGGLLISAVISGAIAALPVYLDVVLNAQQSARLAVSDQFFLTVLPRLENLTDFGLFLITIVDPFIYGIPISQTYPLTFFNHSSFYNGLSLSPLHFFLFILSFHPILLRQFWYWHLFAVLCLIGTLYPPAYLFAVHALGFQFSRTVLLSGSIIVALILIAHTIDFLSSQRPDLKVQSWRGDWRGEMRSRLPRLPWNSSNCIPQQSGAKLKDRFSEFNLGLLLSSLLIAINFMELVGGFREKFHFSWHNFLINWLMVAGIILFAKKRNPGILFSLAIATVFLYGQPLLLARPMNSIQTTSPLVEAVRQQTDGQGRFAIVGADLSGVLPANQEGLLRLKSIHSYDSLSSQNYQKIVEKWSDVGSTTYGRLFTYLDRPDKIVNPKFRLSGVNLLLSKTSLNESHFAKVGQVNDIQLYRPLQPPIFMMQTLIEQLQPNDLAQSLMSQQASIFQPVLLRSWDDYQEIQVGRFSQVTQLFLSQQYHAQWQAFSGKTRLKTMAIDQFYQGVIIPPYTDKIILCFMPNVLWSWVPQLIYLGIGMGGAGYLGFRKILDLHQKL